MAVPEKRIRLKSDTVFELCRSYAELPPILAALGFKDITRPGMLNTAGRFMTLARGAALKRIDVAGLAEALRQAGFTVEDA